MRHAFADESLRKGQYLMCATSVPISEMQETRKALRRLRLSGQRRIHFTNESDSRRKSVLTTLASLQASSSIYTVSSRDQTAARKAILLKMVADLRTNGITRLVLDSRQVQDQKDRSSIHAILDRHPDWVFEYSHQPSAHEPILWIPDAVAWAWGRGGEWRRRVERLGLISNVTTVELP